ncbi:TIGR03862 family flavoprotein [Limnohabitans sp. Jir72]|uniref:TIGR03862 family flavoprotein n=1 Tax=Limnohabitans sp. Jir72 TaxID=1977909 RepID=UPI000D3933DB|nr:TIGR03862 family flavoprotein [Limnohabitans sp. Jir72]PUE28032.1 aminoacetone oxidase family FAD-binding enzyme [Limnohabitans sp. Jir72]
MSLITPTPQVTPSSDLSVDVAIIGGGPAGLMAADVLSHAGVCVHLFDAMPSVGRKFLLAGRGGLNLTHSEDATSFRHRYGEKAAQVGRWLDVMDAQAVRDWAHDLGIETFVGTSGRVFPIEMKAAPLLRAWLHRLRHPASGVPVQFHMRHRWLGWQQERLLFDQSVQATTLAVRAKATVLALGGASWPRLGSDGAWVPLLGARGVAVNALKPANCGFDVLGRGAAGWSDHFRTRFAGHPVKSVAILVPAWADDNAPARFLRKGEFVVTESGIEGSLVYAASAWMRDDLQDHGQARLLMDLLPDKSPEQVLSAVKWPRGSRSLSSHLKSRLGLDGVKMGLLHELCSPEVLSQPEKLAQQIKGLPLPLKAARPVDEAISTAGGVAFEGLTASLMVQNCPHVYCAGEMLDWEAPTGGYLLTACLASGKHAAHGILENIFKKT